MDDEQGIQALESDQAQQSGIKQRPHRRSRPLPQGKSAAGAVRASDALRDVPAISRVGTGRTGQAKHSSVKRAAQTAKGFRPGSVNIYAHIAF